MEISEVRRRVRQLIERARQNAAERRARHDAAGRDYQLFLTEVATPVCRRVASSLSAEGYPFKVYTPAGAVRLTSDRAGDDSIELGLDTSGDLPVVLVRVSRRKGRDMRLSEQPLREGAPISQITEDDVLEMVLGELEAFVER
jgi:hypothetical protein